MRYSQPSLCSRRAFVCTVEMRVRGSKLRRFPRRCDGSYGAPLRCGNGIYTTGYVSSAPPYSTPQLLGAGNQSPQPRFFCSGFYLKKSRMTGSNNPATRNQMHRYCLHSCRGRAFSLPQAIPHEVGEGIKFEEVTNLPHDLPASPPFHNLLQKCM